MEIVTRFMRVFPFPNQNLMTMAPGNSPCFCHSSGRGMREEFRRGKGLGGLRKDDAIVTIGMAAHWGGLFDGPWMLAHTVRPEPVEGPSFFFRRDVSE
jgi:hypothetical protein